MNDDKKLYRISSHKTQQKSSSSASAKITSQSINPTAQEIVGETKKLALSRFDSRDNFLCHGLTFPKILGNRRLYIRDPQVSEKSPFDEQKIAKV